MNDYDNLELEDIAHQGYPPYDPSDDSSSVSTTNTNKKRQRKLLDELKKKDPGYFKVKRFIDHKKKDIEVYSTSTTPGCTIRDAVTGAGVGKFYVGKRDEDMFFKVRLAGESGSSDRPVTLFYDNPEQYERHLRTVVDSETKEHWLRKYLSELRRREK